MLEWPNVATKWLRRLVGGKQSEAQTDESVERVVTTGALAVLAIESLISEGLYRGRSTSASGQEASDLGAVNAFGRSIVDTRRKGARGILASAVGMSLTGHRAAAFLPGDRLAEVHDQLFAAVGRRTPLVVHAIQRAMPRQSQAFGTDHSGYHAIEDTGAFLAHARNVQHAVDLTIAARWLSERWLGPGVVAMDGAETALAPQDLVFPDPLKIVELLGRPDDAIECPTEAQRILFGQFRNTLPAWFDFDRPTAHGAVLAGQDYAVGCAGQDLFFSAHLRELAEQALAHVSKATGRPLSFVHTHRLEDAKVAIVVQGSAVETAEAVVDELHKSGTRCGVVSIDWLRPFPDSEVLEALGHLDAVAVLERIPTAGNNGPLFEQIRGVLGEKAKLTSISYGVGGQPVTVGQIAGAIKAIGSKATGDGRAYLGLAPPTSTSALPRREVLLRGVHRAYPKLAERVLEADEHFELESPGVTVSVVCSPESVPEDGLSTIAESLSAESGQYVRGRSRVLAHRVWAGSVTVADQPVRDLGDDLSADILVVTTLDVPAYLNPLLDVKPRGSVLFGLPFTPEQLAERLPWSWTAAVTEGDLRLYLAPFDWSVIAEHVAVLAGSGELERWLPTDTRRDADLEKGGRLPALIKRIQRNDTRYDNPARFWGEVIQPRMLGEVPQPIPDPYLALGAVPASTATFRDASPSRAEIPLVSPDLCTGCGRCWTACPDSALGPAGIGFKELFDSAAARIGSNTPLAGKITRAHKHLATRTAKLAHEQKATSLSLPLLLEAGQWLKSQLNFDEEASAEADGVLDRLFAEALRIPGSVTDAFFYGPEAAKKGDGGLFLLAINPTTCQGCASCEEACPEAAINMVPQTVESIEAARDAWSAFEETPDTPGSTIERVGQNGDLGPLASVLLSRHCQQALAGGSASEPGSGARLATRLAAGAIEYQTQRRYLPLVQKLTELGGEIDVHIRREFGDENIPADLGELKIELQQRGRDADQVARTVKLLKPAYSLNKEVTDLKEAIETGANQVGRARFGVVVTSGEVGEWAARFPHNPFFAPLAVDMGGDGPELALGVAEGSLATVTDAARLVRKVQLWLDKPADVAEQLTKLEALTWRNLTADERAWAPCLVLLADAETLGDRALSGLSAILASDLPVRVLLLDRRLDVAHRVDPTSLGLAHRRAYVLSSSVGHPDHLFGGLVEALAHPGPALVHVYAPSPRSDRFGKRGAVERAKLAVECRVHPLLRYNPTAEGVFGTRIDLTGNPDLTEAWVRRDESNLTPLDWTVSLGRFDRHLASSEEPAEYDLAGYLAAGIAQRRGATVAQKVGEKVLAVGRDVLDIIDDRVANWRMLQELAGLVTPFTEQIRGQVASETATDHQREIESLKQEFEAKLTAAKATERAAQAQHLRNRLMQLAGFGGAPTGGEN